MKVHLQRDAALQLIFSVVLLSFNGCSNSESNPVSEAVSLQQVQNAFNSGEHTRVVEFARQLSVDADGYQQAMLLAGESSKLLGRLDEALKFFAEVPDDTSEQSLNALFLTGEIFQEQGKLLRAAEIYDKVLVRRPKNIGVHERLAFIYSVTGQNWKSLPHFQFLCRSGEATISNLAIYADLCRPVTDEDFIAKCEKTASDDPFVRLALCLNKIRDEETRQAKVDLKQLVQGHPELSAAQAALGKLLLHADQDQFLNWMTNLPEESFHHPDIWVVAGSWAREQKDVPTAMSCFWSALRISPTHREAMTQLGQMLTLSNAPEAERVNKLAEYYAEITQYSDHILRETGNREVNLKQMISRCLQTGRIWEACAWTVIARNELPDAKWVNNVFNKYAALLNESLPRVVDERNASKWFDFSNDKSFEQLVSRERKRMPPEIASQSLSTHLQGIDRSFYFERDDVGIDFVYNNGHAKNSPAAREFETTGGGVAVLDFDLDGTPDLFFTQGGSWPWGNNQPDIQPDQRDALFSQLDDIRYLDVTNRALPKDTGFGQGVSVGDFNGDGFPDLYVGNVGRNQLLQNMGDGTFLDVTESTGVPEDLWTTSVLVIDLNADGHPDLFDTNYFQGPDVYTKVCGNKACSPLNFSGSPNRIWINDGTGRFNQAKIDEPLEPSKSLGVVTVFSEESNIPSLFIANDQTQNFFLQPVQEKNSKTVQFVERALSSGLAFNGSGLAMGCMGIATADLNHDGLSDLFVTNFKNESNTVYLQDIPGLFTDMTSRTGLSNPGFKHVGWGTQFLDANLDGEFDLVVTNGHFDNNPEEGVSLEMPLQFFVNKGEIKFEEYPQAGQVFQEKFSGRSLVKLDWNRDGLLDFAVSTVNSPALLVTNRSTAAGNFLNVKLHARSSSRDAIGSRCTLVSQRKLRTQILTAGDGYQASNERLIQFACEKTDPPKELRVLWPSGAQTIVDQPELNSTLELFEGLSVGTQWKLSQPTSIECQCVPN